MKIYKTVFAAMALALGLSGAAWADVISLTGNAPAAVLGGQQSDTGTAPYTQSFATPTSMVSAIRWWGFYAEVGDGAVLDQFLVTLNGVVQTGTLTVDPDAAGYAEYTLDIVDAVLLASDLSIANTDENVAWFWQSAAAIGSPGAADEAAVAFSLLGDSSAEGSAVPEPQSLLLAVGGLAMLGLARRKRQVK